MFRHLDIDDLLVLLGPSRPGKSSGKAQVYLTDEFKYIPLWKTASASSPSSKTSRVLSKSRCNVLLRNILLKRIKFVC